MVVYGLAPLRTKRPILAGSDAVQLYWITYLAFLTLFVAFGAAAIIR